MVQAGRRAWAWGLTGALCLGSAAIVARALRHVPGGSQRAAGALVCDEPDFDFGERAGAAARSVEHEFTVRNTGAGPVRIVKKTTSCTCTSAELSSEVVAPQAAAHVRVAASWTDRDGPQSAQVMLVTDEGPASALRLTIKGWINNPLTVSPRELDFGELPPGPSAEREFEVIERAGDASFRVTGIQVPAGVQLRRVGPPASPGLAAASSLAGGPGRFAARVTAGRQPRSACTADVLVSTSLSADRVPVRLKWHSTGAIVARPGSVLFEFRPEPGAPAPPAAEVHVRAAPNGADAAITATVISNAGGASFAVERAARAVESDGAATAVFVVRCQQKPDAGIALATLHLACGEDTLDLPLSAIGGPPGP